MKKWPPFLKNKLFYGVIALIVAIALIFLFFPKKRIRITFPYQTFGNDVLKAQATHEASLLKDFKIGPAESQLIFSYFRFCQKEFLILANDPAPNKSLAEKYQPGASETKFPVGMSQMDKLKQVEILNQGLDSQAFLSQYKAFSAEATQYADKNGLGSYYRLGVYLSQIFEKRMLETLKLLKAQKLTFANFLRRKEFEDLAQKYIQIAGGFHFTALKIGFIQPNGEYPAGCEYLFKVLFKKRWLKFIMADYQKQITNFENLVNQIWTVEHNIFAPLSKRLLALEVVSARIKGYNRYLAEGILYYQNFKYPFALKAFKKAQEFDPGNPLISKYRQGLETLLGGQK